MKYFSSVINALFLCLYLSGCSYDSIQKSTVIVFLPQWPPQDSYQQFYPPLQSWHIVVNYGNYALNANLAPQITSFPIELNGNEPVSVLAIPVTDGMEFFKPCGTILPYSQQCSWRQGFTASILDRFYTANIFTKNIQFYALLFNWSKFSQQLESKASDSSIFYNPWHLNQEHLLKALASQNISATYFTQKQCYSVPIEQFNSKSEGIFLSAYIPQNEEMAHNGKTTVPDQTETMFLNINKGKRFLVSVTSSKQEILSLNLWEIPIN